MNLDHLSALKKIIYGLLCMDVKLEEKDTILLLLCSLHVSYNHLITTSLYWMDDVISNLVSNEIEKSPSVAKSYGEDLVAKYSNERGRPKEMIEGGEKSKHISKSKGKDKIICYFYKKKGYFKNECHSYKKWLQKKGGSGSDSELADVVIEEGKVDVLTVCYSTTNIF